MSTRPVSEIMEDIKRFEEAGASNEELSTLEAELGESVGEMSPTELASLEAAEHFKTVRVEEDDYKLMEEIQSKLKELFVLVEMKCPDSDQRHYFTGSILELSERVFRMCASRSVP